MSSALVLLDLSVHLIETVLVFIAEIVRSFVIVSTI